MRERTRLAGQIEAVREHGDASCADAVEFAEMADDGGRRGLARGGARAS